MEADVPRLVRYAVFCPSLLLVCDKCGGYSRNTPHVDSARNDLAVYCPDCERLVALPYVVVLQVGARRFIACFRGSKYGYYVNGGPAAYLERESKWKD